MKTIYAIYRGDAFVDVGKQEWGAEPGKLYYVLKILNVEEIEDVKQE